MIPTFNTLITQKVDILFTIQNNKLYLSFLTYINNIFPSKTFLCHTCYDLSWDSWKCWFQPFPNFPFPILQSLYDDWRDYSVVKKYTSWSGPSPQFFMFCLPWPISTCTTYLYIYTKIFFLYKSIERCIWICWSY